MKRTTIFIDEQLEHDLRLLSKRSGRPVASLVREAMTRYVASETDGSTPRLGFEARGRSGRHDVAEAHETLLWAEAGPHTEAAPARPARRRGVRRKESTGARKSGRRGTA